jgi:uncharacterized protein (TIGR00251 family)
LIAITAHAEGSVIGVRAQPGARKNGVAGEHNGLLKVAVTAPADKGRANDALVVVLAAALGVKRSQIELISGPTSREKKYLIRGISLADLERRVAEMLASA